jgi:hypothetical protein
VSETNEHRWVAGSDRRFATLLSYARTYLHPEVYNDAIDDLRYLLRLPEDRQDPDTRRFKAELRMVILGQTEGLPPSALSEAAEYDDGDQDTFVRRLWRDLFPDEPLPERTPAP